MTATLLIEIGVEELPTQAMRTMADAFADGMVAALNAAGIEHGAATRYATPRRLAVSIAETATEGRAENIEKAGPTVAIAFDADGNPTPAGLGFARSVGVDISALEREDSDKGERLVHRARAAGKPLGEILQQALDTVVPGLPVAKRMRWGSGDAVFVRPVHWLVGLHGNAVVALSLFGQASDRITHGHRIHHPQPITLDNADDYAAMLEAPGHVVADPDQRREIVIAAVEAAAESLQGQALISDALVEEVIALVEWPCGIAGRFDARFLALPREVLIATLEGHQRYFPVQSADGALVAGFVTIANIQSRDVAQVVAGNERVVRPRLTDALFFWQQDCRHGLAANIEKLAHVSFQQQLGSLADKCARVLAIAQRLCDATGAQAHDIERAAMLCKADLLTEMVGEFPELQGIMGRYYAIEAGEDRTVADAIAEHYRPIGANAPIAASSTGRALALADRLDTLAGIFAIGKRPSGDKDPFALRRAAIGVLRTLVEGDIALDLRDMLDQALAAQPVEADEDTLKALWLFHVERLRGYYLDRGVTAAQFDAVRALDIVDIRDFDRRLQAVAEFSRTPEAAVIGAAHKRIRNILKKNADEIAGDDIQDEHLIEPPEKTLAETFRSQRAQVEACCDNADYVGALAALAAFASPLDDFFAQVMVMDDNADLRHNRLALLSNLDGLFRRVADLSCLSAE